MDAKLTLKLDKAVIEKAKKYAADHEKSLSWMVESYLKTLVERNSIGENDDFEISPFVKSMRTGVKIPADFEYQKAYLDYLTEKHK
jgi:hypothetical protein